MFFERRLDDRDDTADDTRDHYNDTNNGDDTDDRGDAGVVATNAFIAAAHYLHYPAAAHSSRENSRQLHLDNDFCAFVSAAEAPEEAVDRNR